LYQDIATIPMDKRCRWFFFRRNGNILAIVTDSGTLRLLRATTIERAEAQARL